MTKGGEQSKEKGKFSINAKGGVCWHYCSLFYGSIQVYKQSILNRAFVSIVEFVGIVIYGRCSCH
jgi:hypothetical protein